MKVKFQIVKGDEVLAEKTLETQGTFSTDIVSITAVEANDLEDAGFSVHAQGGKVYLEASDDGRFESADNIKIIPLHSI